MNLSDVGGALGLDLELERLAVEDGLDVLGTSGGSSGSRTSHLWWFVCLFVWWVERWMGWREREYVAEQNENEKTADE